MNIIKNYTSSSNVTGPQCHATKKMQSLMIKNAIKNPTKLHLYLINYFTFLSFLAHDIPPSFYDFLNNISNPASKLFRRVHSFPNACVFQKFQGHADFAHFAQVVQNLKSTPLISIQKLQEAASRLTFSSFSQRQYFSKEYWYFRTSSSSPMFVITIS